MNISRVNDLLDEVIAAAHASGYHQAMYEQAEKSGWTTDATQSLHENTTALCQCAELRDMLLREITSS